MIEALKILLSLSLSGTLLILILLLCKPLYRHRLSRQWQYYVWLLVVARLLLPFGPKVSLMGNLFQCVSQTGASVFKAGQSEPASPLPQGTNLTEHDIFSGNQGFMRNSEPAEAGKPPVQGAEMAAGNGWLVCALVWLMVAVGFLIRKITVYQSFVKYIRAGSMDVTDMRLWEQLGKLVEQAGIRTSVGLSVNSLISSPLLIGFLRPRIILPSAQLPDTDFQNTVLHELTHYKRRDMFYKWLVQITICLHWFNPFVHLMGREMNRDCEFSCDEAVIRTLDRQSRRSYGNTLLNAAGTGGNYKDSLASVTLNENAERLKERLDAIMNYKKKNKVITGITFITTLLLAIGANATGVYARTQTPESIPAPVSALEDLEADRITTITITADSCGIELVKSENGRFTFDYLGISDTSKYPVEYTVDDDALQITVDGTAARDSAGHYYIESGPNYVNVVRIGIPDQEYQDITLTLHGAPITLPDYNAAILIESDDGSITVSDTEIAKGTFAIHNLSGSVSVRTAKLSSNISVVSEGECELIFNEAPQDLKLDVSDCRGQVVLPDGWSTTFRLGNGTPSVKISNHGYTEVTIDH